ncbi:MAG: ATP-binding protein [Campylobacterales bacterium]|nr:ATP-binding protein [Campylobacterales bacterium]
MELVYLWIEKYKNIENQGFNFSPRFKCVFDGKNLKITDKEKTKEPYPKNFFGDNINITAIVGKNGSGKSSILELMNSSVEENKDIKCLFLLGETFYGSFEKNMIHKEYLENYCNLQNDDFKKRSIFIFDKDDVVLLNIAQVLEKKASFFSFLNADFIFTKWNITLSTFIPIKLKNSDISLLHIFPINETILNQDEDKKYLNLFLFTVITLDNYQIKNNSHLIKEMDDNFSKEDYFEFLDKIEIKEKNSSEHRVINTLKDFDRSVQRLKELKEKKSINSNDINDLINNDLYFTFYHWLKNNQGYECLSINFLTKKDLTFLDLSRGEQQKISNLSIIGNKTLDLVTSREHDFLFFLLDEPNVHLHPEWQKNLINEILVMTKRELKDEWYKTIHFILTSHSPFLLSDLPKENVIFLDTYDCDEKDKNGIEQKKGNCKVIDPKINTFGANIHTLLSHGFFMKDGLMGEFAKEKIDNVIKILNKPRLTEEEILECENIIKIIGEPIIKRQLQKMLDSKRLSKLDKIGDKIKDLEYELSILKEHQRKVVKDELLDKGKRKYIKKKNNE